jgi:hypothetical protein
METDTFDGAACPASDLAARLLWELTRAEHDLAIAEARVFQTLAVGDVVPADVRTHRDDCRLRVGGLHHLLAGMPVADEGGYHAASA